MSSKAARRKQKKAAAPAAAAGGAGGDVAAGAAGAPADTAAPPGGASRSVALPPPSGDTAATVGAAAAAPTGAAKTAAAAASTAAPYETPGKDLLSQARKSASWTDGGTRPLPVSPFVDDGDDDDDGLDDDDRRVLSAGATGGAMASESATKSGRAAVNKPERGALRSAPKPSTTTTTAAAAATTAASSGSTPAAAAAPVEVSFGHALASILATAGSAGSSAASSSSSSASASAAAGRGAASNGVGGGVARDTDPLLGGGKGGGGGGGRGSPPRRYDGSDHKHGSGSTGDADETAGSSGGGNSNGNGNGNGKRRVFTAQEQHAIFVAGAYIKDALHAKVTSHLKTRDGQTRQAVDMYFMLLTPLWSQGMLVMAWLHLALILLEPPGPLFEWLLAWSRHTVYIAPVIELAFLCVHAAHLYLRHVAREVRSQTIRKTGFVIAVCIADTLVAIALLVFVGSSVDPLHAPAGHFRVARLFRPYFFLRLSRLLKESFENIWEVLAQTYKFFVLIFVYVSIWSLLVFTLLCDFDPVNFGSFGTSWVTMLVLLTTSNFPDVIFPINEHHAIYLPLFVLYVVLGLFFMMNLVLAVIYKTYSAIFKAKLAGKVRRVDDALRKAFQLAANRHGVITEDVWMALCAEVRPDFLDEQNKAMWLVLDEDGNDQIEFDEFQHLVQYFGIEFGAAAKRRRAQDDEQSWKHRITQSALVRPIVEGAERLDRTCSSFHVDLRPFAERADKVVTRVFHLLTLGLFADEHASHASGDKARKNDRTTEAKASDQPKASTAAETDGDTSRATAAADTKPGDATTSATRTDAVAPLPLRVHDATPTPRNSVIGGLGVGLNPTIVTIDSNGSVSEADNFTPHPFGQHHHGAAHHHRVGSTASVPGAAAAAADAAVAEITHDLALPDTTPLLRQTPSQALRKSLAATVSAIAAAAGDPGPLPLGLGVAPPVPPRVQTPLSTTHAASASSRGSSGNSGSAMTPSSAGATAGAGAGAGAVDAVPTADPSAHHSHHHHHHHPHHHHHHHHHHDDTNPWLVDVPELCVDLIVLANVAVLYLDASRVWRPPSTSAVHDAFLWFFCAELLLKVLARGQPLRWGKDAKRFDGVLTIVSCVGELVFSLEPTYSAQAIHVCRAMRVLRLLRCLAPFRSILRTFAITLKTCFPILGILLCIMYFFAVLGISLFAQRLNPDTIPAHTIYATSNYWPINFDTFANAMLTLFHLVIVNNWMVTMDGAVQATSNWSYVYFIGFYLFGTIVMVNVIVAFTLDTFMMYSDDAEHDSSASGASGGASGADGTGTGSGGGGTTLTDQIMLATAGPAADLITAEDDDHRARGVDRRGHAHHHHAHAHAAPMDSLKANAHAAAAAVAATAALIPVDVPPGHPAAAAAASAAAAQTPNSAAAAAAASATGGGVGGGVGVNSLLAGAFDFGIQQRLSMISAKYKLNIDAATVRTRKKYQSKLIKLLADSPALQAKARLYEGITFYS